jgi:hypothetical protein
MTTSMRKRRRWATRFRPRFLSLVAAGLLLVPPAATAQELTGALVVIVNDTQGGVVVGAVVRVSWPALIGGSIAFTTTETGRLRFQALPRGCYALDIDFPGFIHYHKDIRLAAGVTFEIRAVLSVAGPEQSVDVQGVGARVEARNPGFASVWGPEHQEMIPTRRASMFDLALSLAAVPDGPGESSGVQYGDIVAQAMYQSRLGDNMLVPGPIYVSGTTPGVYQITTPGPAQPINTNAPNWIPFALTAASQFRREGPPSLTSKRYARDLFEVQALGEFTSSYRSAADDETSRWYTELAPFQLNRLARAETATDGRDLLSHARLFALLNIALSDAATSVFDANIPMSSGALLRRFATPTSMTIPTRRLTSAGRRS